MTSRFKKKVVLITGASKGIGEAIALRFAKEGADLELTDIEERALEVAERARETGSRVLMKVADISDREQIASLFNLIEDEFHRLDVSIQNAGMIRISKLDEISEDDWNRVMAVNCTGVFLCCQFAARLMIPQKNGRIINAASGQSRQARAYTPQYAASKAGVVAMTQSLALELAPYGITVNAYCPGVIYTEMWKYNDQEWGKLYGHYQLGEYYQEIVGQIPLGRPGTPEDVAGLMAFLASDDASYITGKEIYINGGTLMVS